MKKLLLLLLWPFSVLAADFSIDLHQVPLSDLVRVVFNDVLKANYVVDSALLSDQSPVTFTLRSVPVDKALSEVRTLLEGRGFNVSSSGGVYRIVKRSESFSDDAEIFVYRPQYRSAQYLLDLSQSLFKTGSFVTSRNNSQALNVGQLNQHAFTQAQAVPVLGQQQNPGVLDNGLNRNLQTEADLIVFRGEKKDVSRLQSLYSQLDKSAGELIVKAVVFEVQTGRKEASAVDLALSLLKGKFGLSLDGSASTSGGFASVKFSGGSLDLTAVFDALSSDDRFKVLTSPRMRVKSGASARFSVGNETPVLSSVSYDSDGRPIQSVDYKPSGVIFELKPYVRETVSDCKVTQQLSQFVPTSNGVNNSPTLIKRELSTEVTISDGQIVLLGGLDDEKSTANNTGLSFLPDFLRSYRAENVKTEIVLMLQADRI